MQHQNPEPESAAPPKIKDTPIIQEQPDSSKEKSTKQDLPDNQLSMDGRPRPISGCPSVQRLLDVYVESKTTSTSGEGERKFTESSELEDGPRDINEAPSEDDLPDLTEPPKTCQTFPEVLYGIWKNHQQNHKQNQKRYR